MSLEAHIGALIQAIASLEAAIRDTAQPAMPAPAAPATQVAPSAPTPPVYAAAAQAAPAAPGWSYAQLQQLCSAKAQELGDPKPVIAVMTRYIPAGTELTLDKVPPASYAQMAAEVQALVRAA